MSLKSSPNQNDFFDYSDEEFDEESTKTCNQNLIEFISPVVRIIMIIFFGFGMVTSLILSIYFLLGIFYQKELEPACKQTYLEESCNRSNLIIYPNIVFSILLFLSFTVVLITSIFCHEDNDEMNILNDEYKTILPFFIPAIGLAFLIILFGFSFASVYVWNKLNTVELFFSKVNGYQKIHPIDEDKKVKEVDIQSMFTAIKPLKIISIVSFILAAVSWLIGLIFSLVHKFCKKGSKSKKNRAVGDAAQLYSTNVSRKKIGKQPIAPNSETDSNA